MKRFLSVALAALMVLGLAASAFAIHAEIPSETQAVVAKSTTQLTLGGELRFRGWYADNVDSNYLPTATDSAAWYDARVRLNVEANVAPGTTGYVQLETQNGNSDGRTSDTYVWGSLNTKPGGTYTPGSALTVLQAWILHKGSGLLGIPAGIKVGHMPLALGEKQFLDHTKFGDDAVVFFMDPTPALHIGLLTAKLSEGSTGVANDDIDGYVALMTYKVNKDNTIGANYTYVRNTNAAQGNEGLGFSNLGLHGNGKVGGLSYAAEVDFQFGKVDKGTATEKKFRGYGIFANLGYKVDPVNIRAGFALGSGDSDLSDNKIKEFQVTQGRDVHYAQVYEFTIRTAAENQVVDSKTRNTSIANTTYYRLGLDYAPMKDLTTSLDGFLIRATKVDPALGDSKNIGWEVDAKITYQIAKNLSYQIFAGYLKPGKYYEDRFGIDKKAVTQAWHSLVLSF